MYIIWATVDLFGRFGMVYPIFKCTPHINIVSRTYETAETWWGYLANSCKFDANVWNITVF